MRAAVTGFRQPTVRKPETGSGLRGDPRLSVEPASVTRSGAISFVAVPDSFGVLRSREENGGGWIVKGSKAHPTRL